MIRRNRRRCIRSSVVAYAAVPLTALAIAAPAQAATVTIDDEDGFDPALAVVPVDSEVTWRNEGTAIHQTQGEIWTSPVLAPGQEFTFRFRKTGSYLYSDPLNPGLEGTIWVIERSGRIGRKGGSAEHRYRATVELAIRESLEYRDRRDPPCQVGTANREVDWKARLPAKYSRSPIAEVLLGEGGRTRFMQYEERREAKLLVDSNGDACGPGGSYRPDDCIRSYIGERLSITLGWLPKDNLMLAANEGPGIGFGSNGNFIHVTDCLDTYLGSELDSDTAPTRLVGERALFDGFETTPSAEDVKRLRAGKRVLVRGGVHFRALDDPVDCCADPGNPDSGVFLTTALFDVQARVKVRLVPRG